MILTMSRQQSLAVLSASILAVILATTACREAPDVKVCSADEIGILGESALIVGRDGGQSALLWGRSVWVFGDTVVQVADASGETWHHNSFSFTDDLDGSDGISGLTERTDAVGSPAYLVPPTPEEETFNAAHRGDNCLEPCGARWAVWPGEPVWDATRNRALIPYGLIYAEPGDFNFYGVGQSFAVWDSFDQTPRRPEVSPGREHPTLLFHEGEPEFGIAPRIIAGRLHIFACPSDGWERSCILGRAALDDVLVRAAWEFFDGDGWSEDWDQAADLFDGAPIMSVAWNDHLQAWTTVYAKPLADRVVLRTAPEITGPWSAEVTLFEAQRGGESWIYDAALHPEYAEENGRVQYITFSRPTGEGWFDAEFAVWRVVLDPDQ